jgi:predicted RNA-binding protein YlqC (UPF0109 family)
MDTKKTAQAIKALLVKMAVEDKLPLNMNGLSISGIEKILKKAVKDAQPTQLQKAIENARHYLCDNNLTVEQQVDLIASETDMGKIIDDIDGVVVWEPLERRYGVEEFLDLISY